MNEIGFFPQDVFTAQDRSRHVMNDPDVCDAGCREENGLD